MFNVKLKQFSKRCNLNKKEALAQVFPCEFCEISKDIFSDRTPPVTASGVPEKINN